VRAFGLGARLPGIGELAIGRSSDIVIFEPDAQWTVEPSRFASKGKNTPLGGQELVGIVRAVVVGGDLKFEMEAANA
jgi:dihydroorotase